MPVQRVGAPVDIAVSGLRAQSARLNAISSNIANANTSRTDAGGPFRRLAVSLAAQADNLAGVSVSGVTPDMTTPFKSLYLPGHPDADAEGYVQMPNVDLPVEIMEMVDATRAYQANAAVLKRYQEIMDLTTELLR